MLEKLKLGGGHNEKEDCEDEDKRMYENPKRALYDLKSLYEANKIEFSKAD